MEDTRQKVLQAPEPVLSLLTELHAQSLAQEDALRADGGGYSQVATKAQTDPQGVKAFMAELMRDKFIALEEDKALFVYQLLRATKALHVVECGTSFGVSTIYLALAVGQNAHDANKGPEAAKVFATEHEPTKASKAKEVWRRCGTEVESWIELREGDALQTLQDVPMIDFVLLDIWTPMVLPIMKVLEPHLRPGCVIVADNTISSAKGYQDYFDHINAPNSGYRTITLPYSNGLEMTIYHPQK